MRSVFLVSAIAFASTTGAVCAGDTKSSGWVKGMVTGEDGKGLGGAEVRAQRVDGKKVVAVAKSDPDGRYWFKSLPVGAYTLTAFVDGAPMSRANIRTRNDGWAKVDFDLRLNAKGADGADRMQRDLRFGPGSIHPRDSNQMGGL